MYLTLDQFCVATGIDRGNVGKRKQTGRLALAYGRDAPHLPGRYTPMDVYATALGEAIAPICGAVMSARIVRERWFIGFDALRNWEWQVADCGDGAREPAPIVVFVGRERTASGAYFVTNGTLSHIAADLETLPDGMPHPATYVSIRDLLADIRTRARAAGIDLLDQPFFPPHDHPDRAALQRLLDGIAEASALQEQMNDAVARRRAIAIGQRTERVWLQ